MSPISRVSAGLLMYRIRQGELEVLLAHPGGPYFTHKDEGCWSIPKGELGAGEDFLDAARREFFEETCIEPVGEFLPLGSIQQKGGKIVHAWAFRGDLVEGHEHRCNTFRMEWPPGSRRYEEFPEVDRVEFFSLSEARRKLKSTQHPFLDRLSAAVAETR